MHNETFIAAAGSVASECDSLPVGPGTARTAPARSSTSCTASSAGALWLNGHRDSSTEYASGWIDGRGECTAGGSDGR